MSRRATLGRLVAGVALIGGFFAWLVVRWDVLDVIGRIGEVSVGLAFHGAAWLLLAGGVSLIVSARDARLRSRRVATLSEGELPA